ncbi:alpha/beta hydrolase family protein [Simkania sp.]|uniref:alpha/beta hydrolase family protein n=1 Tax=Simkania sp. TaxID=34094 RepID=UPI003B530264
MIKQLLTAFGLLAAANESHEAISVNCRPQEPKGVPIYAEEEVKYRNSAADVTLAGTLTLPRSEKPSTAVLLIAGSGRVDRDETVFGHKPFLVLADHLTKHGIAVLRVDKRGIRESTGNYDDSTSEDFAADVLAGVEYLKTRKEIDAKQIGLIGHSEGGLIAPMVAVKSDDVAFIVLMAAQAVTGETLVYTQEALISRSMGVTEEQISHQLDFQKQVLSVIINEPDLENAEKLIREIVSKQLADLPDEEQQAIYHDMESQIRRCNSQWFRYFLTYDPKTSLKHLKIPVLAINGQLDCQVTPKQNLTLIGKILEEAGNQNYRVIEFPKLNHFFQSCESGSILEYGKIEQTIAPVVLETLSDWILETTTFL